MIKCKIPNIMFGISKPTVINSAADTAIMNRVMKNIAAIMLGAMA